MEQNFSCSKCGQLASFFCLCTPSKIYLCGMCLASHITKEGAHPIVPIEGSHYVNQPSDLELYNKRLKISKDMLTAMDSILAAVGEEEQMLARNIAEEKQKVIDSVNRTFESLQQKAAAEYQAVREIVEQGRTNVANYEKEKEKSGKKSMELWTSLSVHYSELQPLLLGVSEFCSKSVVVRIEEIRGEIHHPILNTLKEWETTACRCEMCVSARDIFLIESSKQGEHRKGNDEWLPLQLMHSLPVMEIKAGLDNEKPCSSMKSDEKKKEQGLWYLSILSVGFFPKGNLRFRIIVTIGKNREGECSGYVAILKNGECILYSPDALPFTGMDEIDISEWAPLEPGSYELAVIDPQWQNALSEKFAFTTPAPSLAVNPDLTSFVHEKSAFATPAPSLAVYPVLTSFVHEKSAFTTPAPSLAVNPDPYLTSFVHDNLENLPECEEYVKNQLGEPGLLMFKHLVTEWKNPSMEQMFPFVQAVMAVCSQDEVTAKTALLSHGFQL